MSITANMVHLFSNAIISQIIDENETPPTLDQLDALIEKFFVENKVPYDGEDRRLISLKVREQMDLETLAGPAIKSKDIRYERISDEQLSIFKDKESKKSYFWNRFKRYKELSNAPLVRNINRDTNRILEHMPNPDTEENFTSLGMVIGDVQAGKTSNYTGLINKAVDLGYRIIIVLTGTTENLRSQTQKRLDYDFVGQTTNTASNRRVNVGVGNLENKDPDKTPQVLTDTGEDLKLRSGSTNIQTQTVKGSTLIVTKKNSKTLSHLSEWLNRQGDEVTKKGNVRLPVLLIDDESDNASVNTGKEDESPKTINRGLREIISQCDRIAYCAYTATPFANIFIDPDGYDSTDLVDLYPRDFIVALQPPAAYCGGDFFYCKVEEDTDDTNHNKFYIEDAEDYYPLKHRIDDSPAGLAPSLKKALRQFFICCAIKDIRRKSGLIPKKDRHDSCLINVSRFASYQGSLALLIEEYIDEKIIDGLQLPNQNKGSMLDRLKSEFEDCFVKIKEVKEDWIEVKKALLDIGADSFRRPKVVTINGDSVDELKYGEDPQKYIAVGGFKLSRGLTLEGLVVSYCYRASRMGDTLMQMARWFGYREGYRNLVILWSSKTAVSWYREVTEQLKELKYDLIEMERMKREPSEFGVRVKASELGQLITAKNKMRSGKRISLNANFSDTFKETFFVDARPKEQEKNTKNIFRFLESLNSEYDFKYTSEKKKNFGHFSNVSANSVLDFLNEFDIHLGNPWNSTNRYLPFVKKRKETDYKNWDIAFFLPVHHARLPTSTIVDKFKAGFGYRTIKTLQKKSSLAERNTRDSMKLAELAEYELPLGDYGKVSQGNIEAIGVKGMSYNEAQKLSVKECRNYPDKNPLLVVHLIEVRYQYDNPDETKRPTEESKRNMERLEKITKNNYYPSISISLPETRDGGCYSEEDDFFLTKIEFEKIYGEMETAGE